MHAKTALVILLIAYHLYCGRLFCCFEAGEMVRGHVWFRFFNEIPVLVMFAVIFLVVRNPSGTLLNPPGVKMTETFFLPCPRGLEALLVDELAGLGPAMPGNFRGRAVRGGLGAVYAC